MGFEFVNSWAFMLFPILILLFFGKNKIPVYWGGHNVNTEWPRFIRNKKDGDTDGG
jgi:hypothetical protein